MLQSGSNTSKPVWAGRFRKHRGEADAGPGRRFDVARVWLCLGSSVSVADADSRRRLRVTRLRSDIGDSLVIPHSQPKRLLPVEGCLGLSVSGSESSCRSLVRAGRNEAPEGRRVVAFRGPLFVLPERPASYRFSVLGVNNLPPVAWSPVECQRFVRRRGADWTSRRDAGRSILCGQKKRAPGSDSGTLRVSQLRLCSWQDSPPQSGADSTSS